MIKPPDHFTLHDKAILKIANWVEQYTESWRPVSEALLMEPDKFVSCEYASIGEARHATQAGALAISHIVNKAGYVVHAQTRITAACFWLEHEEIPENGWVLHDEIPVRQDPITLGA